VPAIGRIALLEFVEARTPTVQNEVEKVVATNFTTLLPAGFRKRIWKKREEGGPCKGKSTKGARKEKRKRREL